MLEASIALFARRHTARQSDTILWMTWLLVAFQHLAFPSSRNLQAYLVPTGNVPMDFPSFPGKTVRHFAGILQVICPLANSHFRRSSWCRGGSRTRCIPQGSEIRGFRWSICLLPLPSRTWEYQALQLASSFQTLAEDWLTVREKAAKPVTCFRDAQSWYSALTLFCCSVARQFARSCAQITRHTQLFVDFSNF